MATAREQEIARLEAQRQEALSKVAFANKTVQELKARGGESTRDIEGQRAVLQKVGGEVDTINQRLDILRTSGSVEEAQSRQSFFQRQQTAEEVFQREQRGARTQPGGVPPGGVAVGTGARGGLLVDFGGGRVEEVFQSRADAPRDIGRERFIREGTSFEQETPSPVSGSPFFQDAPRRSPAARGALSLTEQEFGSLDRSPRVGPILVVPSDTAPSFGLEIGRVLGGVDQPPRIPGEFQPESAVIERQRRVSTVQAFAEEPSRTFEAADARGAQIADVMLSKRTPGQVSAQRFTEPAVGVAQLGIGIAEFGVNIFAKTGTQTFTGESETGLTGIKSGEFRFGGTLGAIQAQPRGVGTTLGQIAVATPFIAFGVSEFIATRAVIGTTPAVIETVSQFAPFQIRGGTFGALEGAGASQLNVKVLEVQAPVKPGTKARAILEDPEKGVLGFADLRTVPTKPGESISVADTTFTAPATKFRAGTGFEDVQSFVVSEGVALSQTGILRGGGTRQAGGIRVDFSGGIEGVGGVSKAFSRPTTKFVVSKTGQVSDLIVTKGAFSEEIVGGFSQEVVPGVSIIRAGRGKVQKDFAFSTEGGLRRRVRVDQFNVEGVSFDLSKVRPSDTGVKISLGEKPPTTKPSLTLQETTAISSGVGAIQRPPTVITRPSAEFPSGVQLGGKGTSAFGRTRLEFEDIGPGVIAGTKGRSLGVVEPPRGGLELRGSLIERDQFAPKGGTSAGTISKVGTGVETKVGVTPVRISRPITDFGPKIDITTKAPQITRTTQIQDPLLEDPPPPPPTFLRGGPGPPGSFKFPFIGFFPPFGGGFGGRKGRKAPTRGFQRTPSLGAVLQFELTGFGGGKRPKVLEETGLVPRGFGFKVPKIKLPTIL